MAVIVPAILVTTRKELDEKLARLRGIVDSVQIDAIDGQFSAPASWPYVSGKNELAALVDREEMLPYGDLFRFEADLMVTDPEAAASAWVAVGVTRLTLHAARGQDLAPILERLALHFGHDKDFIPDLLSFGIALTVDDDPRVLDPVLDKIDYVQYMGIAHIGRQGEPFDSRTLEHVHTLHHRHPDLPIQVDGGVSLESAPALLGAGVSRLVIGSGIWGSPDVSARIQEFESLALRYGVYER
ncbi:MAG: hypothetical protein B7X04_03475 [Parcubacteria group bacterium 21-54-25]|nr:MAG: hypothetical protein B7X04_03475 [Parcubacteria group bacterium 21-54-25]HQU08011.1 hypothetical protein [Candidatus Paceibacterota bacterium]